MEMPHSGKPLRDRPPELGAQISAVAGWNKSFVRAVTESSQCYLDGVVEMMQEWTDFMTARTREDAELARSCADCGDWSGIATIQQDWARQTADEYVDEAQKLARIGRRVLFEGITPFCTGIEPQPERGKKTQS